MGSMLRRQYSKSKAERPTRRPTSTEGGSNTTDDVPKVDFSDSFDALNLTNFSTMQKILYILEEAEDNHVKPKRVYHDITRPISQSEAERYQNRFATLLGQEIFGYNVIRILNDKQLIQRNAEFYDPYPQAVMPLYHLYIEQFKSLLMRYDSPLKQPTLNIYQSLAHLFIEQDAQCYRRIRKDLRNMSKQIVKHRYSNYANKVKLGIPHIAVPNYRPYETVNPLVLDAPLANNGNELNILPFILNDRSTIESVFGRLQVQVDPDMVRALMYGQALEGAAVFRIMIKKKLHLIDKLQNRELILNFLLNDNDNPEELDIDIVKAVVAASSDLHCRFGSYGHYKVAVGDKRTDFDDDAAVIKALAHHFDRYLGVRYRINPKAVDEWIVTLINWYISHANKDDVIPTTLATSIRHFRDFTLVISLTRQLDQWLRSTRQLI